MFPDYGLDSGELSLLEQALPRPAITRLKMSLAKAIMFPQQGMMDRFESRYQETTGGSIWDGGARFSPQAMLEALKPMTLDIAYGGMRRNFFTAEATRQSSQGAAAGPCAVPAKSTTYAAEKQKALFVNYWAHQNSTGAFEKALGEFSGEGTKVCNVLETTLLVRTGFHRMLVARELSFLIDAFPRDGGARVVNVGGGATKVVKGAAWARPMMRNRTTSRQSYSKIFLFCTKRWETNSIWTSWT